MNEPTFKPGDHVYYLSPYYGRIAFGRIVSITDYKALNYSSMKYAIDLPLIEEPEEVKNVFATKQALLDFLMSNVINDTKS